VAKFGLGLCVVYVVLKTCVRYWLFRAIPERPAAVRNNEVLRFLDLGAMVALIGAFFLLANEVPVVRAGAVVVVLLLYDLVVRRVCLELEVRRMLARSKDWSHSEAVRHVRRRALSPMFH
jgi:hypothetical protein